LFRCDLRSSFFFLNKSLCNRFMLPTLRICRRRGVLTSSIKTQTENLATDSEGSTVLEIYACIWSRSWFSSVQFSSCPHGLDYFRSCPHCSVQSVPVVSFSFRFRFFPRGSVQFNFPHRPFIKDEFTCYPLISFRVLKWTFLSKFYWNYLSYPSETHGQPHSDLEITCCVFRFFV